MRQARHGFAFQVDCEAIELARFWPKNMFRTMEARRKPLNFLQGNRMLS